MKQISFLLFIAILFGSCGTHPMASAATDKVGGDTTIVESLFDDKSSSISEENIRKLLDGTYQLPASLRIAIVRLGTSKQRRYFWNDEYFQKSQQSYLDSFTVRLRSSHRVASVSVVPSIMMASTPSFTSIREAAVRMQCNMVLVYSISGDYYSRYNLFKNPDLKAFATTELLLMDVRTGLIPFSTTVTRDVLTRKTKDDLDVEQTRDRVLNEAALATINDVGSRIVSYLGNP
ncbi:MAG: hypothetical protein BGO55_29255 [Sphingobacteriales bacterium 50-39]|nr:hypothetical protein [Sphingobacteriales bacterium]OJW60633.1 MAG: hypothetical protein BGO55_29255 [Sphingobacteriales bacterium 50-39]